MPHIQGRLYLSSVDEIARDLGGPGQLGGIIERVISLGADSSPEVDSVYAALVALTAGAVTLDLTALVRTGLPNLTLSTKTVYGYAIENRGANAMTFTQGAADGYAMFTTGGVVIGGGGIAFQYSPTGFGAVGAGDTDVDVAGTGTQQFAIILWAGAAA